MESEMDLQLMLLPAVVDPLANNNNNNNTNNKMVVVNCRDEEAEYLERLLTEKKIVDSTAGLDWTQKLINAEIERLLSGGSVKDSSANGGSSGGSSAGGSKRFCDVTKDKPIKVTVRTSVPTRDHPKFNFVGKLLGPKGNSLKRLQEETLTKMAILGRGSMRDKHKEEEYRHSHEPRYRHLNDDLHVEITAYAAPAEAHARIALALTEIRRFLVPDYNDDIRQEQLREMQMMSGGGAGGGGGASSGCSSNASCASQQDAEGQQQQQQQQHLAAVRSVAGLTSSTPNVMTLNSSLHQHLSAMANQQPGGMTAPLQRAVAAAAAAAAANYPPVLPLTMHPALRGLCKPSQNLSIGLTAAAAAGGTASALLNRYRPNTAAGAALQLGGGGSCGPNGLIQQHLQQQQQQHYRRGLRGSFKDPANNDNNSYADAMGPASDPAAVAAVAALELYHRYNMQQPYGSEGSDGVASPDDRDETAESELLASTNGVMTGDYSLLDGTGVNGGLKLTATGAMDRSRYRHEPYPRYHSTKVVT
ncbi:protein quaking-B-like [Daphnia pulex]|uniref:protein quaking-B-like n=1 Tax=Daphnia pulex TaxID=6669 RepID=UPI001EDE4A69|nr:protein quaking-B-like [Daphnia pulex]